MNSTNFASNFRTFQKAEVFRHLRAILPALVILMSFASALHAGNLYVPNYSFESQPTDFADPRVDAWQLPPQPEGFDTNLFGAWNNLAGVFFNSPLGGTNYIFNADGSQLAFLFAYPQMSLFQDYNSTDWSQSPPSHAFNALYTPGKSYTLTVGLTSSSVEQLNQGSTLLLSLYYRDAASNMMTVTSTTVTFDTNAFTNLEQLLDFQVTVPEVMPTDAWANQHIGIQIQSTVAPQLMGGVWDLDNVRLVETVATVLNSPSWTNGQFNFMLQSEPGLAFQIMSSTNLTQAASNWVSVTTFTNVTGTLSFTDTNTISSQRFYRARRL